MTDAEIRLKHHYRLRYKGRCRACSFHPTSATSQTHPAKCPAYFQAGVLYYIQHPEVKLDVFGRSGNERSVGVLPNALAGSGQHAPDGGFPDLHGRYPDHKTTKEYKPKRPQTQLEEGGGSWSSWNYPKQSWKENSLSQQVSGDELRSIVAQLTRLALRHEDMEAANRVDSGFQLYMGTAGDLAMLPRLSPWIGKSKKWSHRTRSSSRFG